MNWDGLRWVEPGWDGLGVDWGWVELGPGWDGLGVDWGRVGIGLEVGWVHGSLT